MYSMPIVRQYASRRMRRISPSSQLLGAAEPAGEELAIEVPDREAVCRGIELGLHPRLRPLERVEVGDEVTAHPVDADERRDCHLLVQTGLVVVDGVDVAPPADRFVGHAERGERRVVETALAHQQLVHSLEEEA